MRLVQDQQPVKTLSPNGSDKALRDAIRLRRPERDPHHLDGFSLKHVVKTRGELRVAISNQELEGLPPICQCPCQLSGLLRDPCCRRPRRAARRMHPATPEFD